VNIIVTSREHLKEFDTSAEIKHKPDASEFSTSHVTNKSRLPAGKWVLILDNTGRLDADTDPVETDIELEYKTYD